MAVKAGELRPGHYTFSGVNIDTLHMHAYQLDGSCKLLADGTLCGHAQETSAVWSKPAVYSLANGTWTASGHLVFELTHSDYRADVFNPFLFHIYLARALPPPLQSTPNCRGPPAPKQQQEEEGDGEDGSAAWQAIGGWWKTADDPANGNAAKVCTPEAAGLVGMVAGSSGRIKCLRLARVR